MLEILWWFPEVDTRLGIQALLQSALASSLVSNLLILGVGWNSHVSTLQQALGFQKSKNDVLLVLGSAVPSIISDA